jgi:hypothetical protein
MLQEALVALFVLIASVYVVWTFMAPTRRQVLLDHLAFVGLLRQLAARHRARLGASGCAHCSANPGAVKVHRRGTSGSRPAG